MSISVRDRRIRRYLQILSALPSAQPVLCPPSIERWRDRREAMRSRWANALQALDMPISLPGETPPIHHPEAMWLTPDGVPFDMFGPEGADLWEQSRAANLVATDFHGRGVRAQVSTVFLVLDHQWHKGGPALTWETMIFGPEALDGYQWRYATRAAAMAGHRAVCETLERLGLKTKAVH